jgi:hypothetical protein
MCHSGLSLESCCLPVADPIGRAQACNQTKPNLAISRVALLGIVSKITQHIE